MVGDNIQLFGPVLAQLIVRFRHEVVLAGKELNYYINSTLFHFNRSTLAFLQLEFVPVDLDAICAFRNAFARFQQDVLVLTRRSQLRVGDIPSRGIQKTSCQTDTNTRGLETERTESRASFHNHT